MIEQANAQVILVAMNGPPGAGKSTLARAVSRHLGWPLIDKDDIKDVLDEQTPLAGALSYEVMLRVVRRQTLQGLSVICDSPLAKRTYDGLRIIAAETGAALVVVECLCGDEAVWRERIEARQRLDLAPHHTTTWDTVPRYLHQPDIDYAIDCPHLIVDTARPLAQCERSVLAWLSGLHLHLEVNAPTMGDDESAKHPQTVGNDAMARTRTGDGKR